jgi:hypothetical protein
MHKKQRETKEIDNRELEEKESKRETTVGKHLRK